MQQQTRQVDTAIDHLFRTEAGKMVAVLLRKLGLPHVAIAQDIVQDTMLAAMQLWPYRGVPPNPAAWLHTVARNKAIDWLRKQKTKRQNLPDLKSLWPSAQEAVLPFVDDEITDSQLRLIFACCHPAFTPEVQLALTLNLVCGFGPDEIARACLQPTETIKKRLFRAKEKFRHGDIVFETPQGSALDARLPMVLHALYLLFNEGYNSTRKASIIDKDLCLEAMRLAILLTEQGRIPSADAYALLALMCFQASRFDARQDAEGHMIALAQQDRNAYSQELIQQGKFAFTLALYAAQPSRYHFEAGIARWHCEAPSYAHTNWPGILECYDMLLQVQDDPLVRLNRVVALARVQGVQQALDTLAQLHHNLADYYLYHAIQADLYEQAGQLAAAHEANERALALTQSVHEQAFIRHKLQQTH